MSVFLKSLLHPTELAALVQYAVRERREKAKSKLSAQTKSAASHERSATATSDAAELDEAHAPDTLTRCYYYLDRTSRSFAAVIRALHPELRDAVCIFYLALRGLDTIEDDMTIPLQRKLQVLEVFHQSLAMPGWTFTENALTDKDRDLLLHFDVVVDQFLRLAPEYREVIQDITKRMADGMAYYCQRAYDQDKETEADESGAPLSGNRVQSVVEYDKYCHYVAGLVGHGLTRLFLASKLERSQSIAADDLWLANSMGLFLQKINITRDFHEDFHENRAFWPKEIWGNYGDSLKALLNPADRYFTGRAALNHMCANALQHVQDVLVYLNELQEPSVFRFCAIPQVMAIATLAEVYDNPRVFQGNVKIRKGLAVQLILNANNMTEVKQTFARFARVLMPRVHRFAAEVNRRAARAAASGSSTLADELARQQAADVAVHTLKLLADLRVACGEPRELVEAGPARAWIVQLKHASTFEKLCTVAAVTVVPVVAWLIAQRLRRG